MKRALAVIAILMMASVCGPVTAAQAETVTLTFSDIYPATHVNSKVAVAWCKEVEKTNWRQSEDHLLSGSVSHQGKRVL